MICGYNFVETQKFSGFRGRIFGLQKNNPSSIIGARYYLNTINRVFFIMFFIRWCTITF